MSGPLALAAWPPRRQRCDVTVWEEKMRAAGNGGRA